MNTLYPRSIPRFNQSFSMHQFKVKVVITSKTVAKMPLTSKVILLGLLIVISDSEACFNPELNEKFAKLDTDGNGHLGLY